MTRKIFFPPTSRIRPEKVLRRDSPGKYTTNITTVSFFEPYLVQFYNATELLSLISWFKLTVTKIKLSTNSLMTFLFFLLKLYSEVPMMSVLYALSMVGKKLLVGFTIDCSIFEFTLLNHCAYQRANSHIESNHFGKCFFLETITF